jgi:ubiquitin C-terminal hydrolase
MISQNRHPALLNYRTKEEMYRYLSIDINADETEDNGDSSVSQKRTVEKCLEHFFKPEDREIKCEKCDDGQVATQTMRVLSRPKAMLLHLKRFVLEEKPREDNNNAENQAPNTSPGMTFRKNKAPVELTQRLSLDRFLAKKEDAAGKNYYSLKSIVHHIGSTADSGHYTADALRKSQDDSQSGTWVSFDDGLTNETTSTKVRNSVQNQKTAYMLLYSTV